MAYIYDGDNGRDTVYQNTNNLYDEIYTYGGNDYISLKANNTYVEAGGGKDYVTSTIEWGNDVYLGTGNDTYVGNGFSNNANHYDRVFGGDGGDTFKISTYASDYYGQDGNDTFYSIGFYNLIAGGSGTDTVDYSRQNSDPDLRGDGIKVDLQNEYATSGGGREETLTSIENAKGTNYDDTLLGTNGANSLYGGNGEDLLNGRSGNDHLYGGKGQDELVGGSGADSFIFASASDSVTGSNRDTITDFSRSQNDIVDLSDIDAISGGNDNSFDYIGNDSFSHTSGELRFSNGILAGDTNGDGKADFQIRIEDVSTLRAGDFLL